jgi:hypothetical protein
MQTWIISIVIFVAILIPVLLILLLPKNEGTVLVNGSDFPYNQNIIIKNTSTTTYTNLKCIDSSGNVSELATDLSSNSTIIYGPVTDTLLIGVDDKKDDKNSIITIVANLDNKVKLFNITNILQVKPTDFFSFTKTNLPAHNNKAGFTTSNLSYTGTFYTPSLTSPIKDNDTFPVPSCMLYNVTENPLYFTSVDNKGRNSPGINPVQANDYTDISLSSINDSDFMLILITDSLNQNSFKLINELLIYNQNGKIRLINIGQPKTLFLLYNYTFTS